MNTTPYLATSDFAAYGAPAAATAAQALQASKMIDAYLKRPEGLLIGTDANGSPAYMLNASPSVALTLTSAIEPGTGNAVFTVSGRASALVAGDAIVIDKGNGDSCETLGVISVAGQTITATPAQFAHAVGASVQFGLLILETKRMPANRPQTRLSRVPIAAIPSAGGRYGYGRRGDDDTNTSTFNMLAVMSAFGGPPSWEPFVPYANGIDVNTGSVWIQSGIFLAYYTEVRFHYVSGWTYDTLPDDIKLACALIMQAQAQAGPMIGNIKTQQAGGTRLDWFKSSSMSDDVKALIDPYTVRAFF